VGASVPLWYADWDYQPNFNNFEPFGGWTAPVGKQYESERDYHLSTVIVTINQLTRESNQAIKAYVELM